MPATWKFVPSIAACNSYVQRANSLNCELLKGGMQQEQRILKKCETVVNIKYKYTCKDFYMFVLKDKDILEAAKSYKKYIFKFK
jgi:hypothetical protein